MRAVNTTRVPSGLNVNSSSPPNGLDGHVGVESPAQADGRTEPAAGIELDV